MPDHRAVAVIDLALFTRSRHDHRMCLDGPLTTKHEDEATDARILGGEAVIIDEIAPDRHGIAAAGERRLDQLAIRCARAGRGRAPWGWRRVQRGGDPRHKGSGVGGHLFGRICQWVAPPSRWPHGKPGGLEVGAGGLAPHPRRLLDAPERPAQSPKCQNLLSLVVAQDVGHAGERDHSSSRRVNVLSAYSLWPVLRCRPMAGSGCRPRCFQALDLRGYEPNSPLATRNLYEVAELGIYRSTVEEYEQLV